MATLFVSDLHLEEGRPDITRAFLHFLAGQARGAEALYLLGDVFEVWIGDDAMGPFEHGIARALRTLADQGTRIYLMHGNRDFLIGRRFCREAGCRLLPEGSVIDLYGEPVLLLHGDSLCTRDEAYQRLRRRLRHPVSRWLLAHLPLSTRRKLARGLRNASQRETRAKAMEITDVTPDAVEQQMRQCAVATLIHGHTHRPARHPVALAGQDGERIVLGDWDRRGWCLTATADGQRHLESFPLSPNSEPGAP